MGKWREETKELSCGCKIGRSGKGPWFYDFMCDKHVEEVRTGGHYDYDKALQLTEKLNQEMKAQETNQRIRDMIPKEISVQNVKGIQHKLVQYYSPGGFVTDVTYRFKTEELLEKLRNERSKKNS